MTDAELVLRARGGDELAFQGLTDRYRPIIVGTAKRYFLKGGEQQDLIQEGLFGLSKAVKDYTRGRGSFRNFARLCISRQIITAVKTATRGKHTILNEAVSLQKPIIGGGDTEDTMLGELLADPTSREAHESLEARDELAKVVDIVSRLSEVEAEAVFGPANGESYKEISARTGYSVKQIDNARQRAKAKLARGLTPVAA